ncbi:unnamed protein product [Gadus morhua 'NCC']|uniref:Chemokine SCYA123 n=1 Tax=Gadus morhua TaxID=8049 RepID=A0A6B7FQX0_GADMO|nr:chemokine SCYA123 [Gadus morhua]
MATRLLMLLSLALISSHWTLGEVPVDCCPGVTDRELPCQRVKSYLVKDASTGCHLDATVYITRRGKQLCVPHPTQRHWVRACITAVDARAARH